MKLWGALGTVLVAAVVLTACGGTPAPGESATARAAEASRAAAASRTADAKSRLEQARDLAAAKRFDDAIAADLRLAGELKDGDEYRQALADAVDADNDKMDGKDFLAQVAILKAFYRQVPSHVATSQIVTGHVHSVLTSYPRTYVNITRLLVVNRERFVKDIRSEGHASRALFDKALGPTVTPQQFRDVGTQVRALGDSAATARLFSALADLSPGLVTYADVDSTLDRTHTTSDRILERLDTANKLVRAKLPAAERALGEAQ